MGGAAELGLEVDDSEGDAEEIDSVARPGQPAGRGSRRARDRRVESIPREEETPLGEGEICQDIEQRLRPLCFLSLWHEVLDEIGRHREEESRGDGRVGSLPAFIPPICRCSGCPGPLRVDGYSWT